MPHSAERSPGPATASRGGCRTDIGGSAAAEIGPRAVVGAGRELAVRRSGGRESVVVELEQVVGRGQEAPFRPDGGSAAA
jgi:hypothetical protein